MNSLIASLIRILVMLAIIIGAIEVFWLQSKAPLRADILNRLGHHQLAQSQMITSKMLLTEFLWKLRQGEIKIHVSANLTDKDRQTIALQAEQRATADDDFSSALSRGLSQMSHVSQQYWKNSACHKPKTQALKAEARHKLYQWRDENGKLHFSDKKPAEKLASNDQLQDLSQQYTSQVKTIELNIETPNWPGNQALQAEISQHGQQIYKIISQFLSTQYLRQINLNIVLFKDVNSFQKFRNNKQANSNFAAYYNSGTNTIYAPNFSHPQQTLNVLKHEISHAILAGLAGYIPVWLNEGLAQYMERVDWRFNSAVVSADAGEFRAVHESNFPALISTDHQDFYQRDHQQNYLTADALTYFLLGHNEGRQWLKATLNQYGRNPCTRMTSQQGFDKYYAGGYSQAKHNWRRWLAQGSLASQRY